ncbi:Crp/Fnr family transcriptional regulator [Sphaerisporangium sp. NPDC051011]|uniref:Crp/Fnr family transcriptional regulator n=1 Tax=Sphaerisporangium sp. NPDC051011 TaxID=3155792 RepID=UPI0033EDD7E4
MDGLAAIVSEETWRSLVSAGVPKIHDPGSVILYQGDPPTHVLLLLAGRVRVSRVAADGTVLILAVRGPGELLGEIAVLGDDDRSATVTAIDRCHTRLIPADRFVALVRSLALEGELLSLAMKRIRESESLRAELAALPAGPRIVHALMRLWVPESGTQASVDVGLDQAELGQATGLSRSTVAAELARLREQGLIVTARRRIVVTDVNALRKLAAE